MFLTGHELLKYIVIENLKGFLCKESKLTADGNLTYLESEEYLYIKNEKHKELENKKNEYYSCFKWYLINKIITENEFEDFQKITLHRNKITHNLPQLLIDESFDFEIDLFDKLEQLINKISKYWILEFHIPSNSDFDNLAINPNDIIPPVSSLMGYLNEITKEEFIKIKKMKS